MAPTFVDVYSRTTNAKQVIPASWLDHPILGADFEKTPRQKASEKKAETEAVKADNLKKEA